MSEASNYLLELSGITKQCRKKMPLFVYGAGHVGRAIIGLLKNLNFDTVWVDTERARFPDEIPDYVTPAITPAPDRLAEKATSAAFHLVLTYSHALDLAICHALLARGDFAFLGLIGSETKRLRFLKRLREGLEGANGSPCNSIVPPSGRNTPYIILTSVDLPAPFSPRSA